MEETKLLTPENDPAVREMTDHELLVAINATLQRIASVLEHQTDVPALVHSIQKKVVDAEYMLTRIHARMP